MVPAGKNSYAEDTKSSSKPPIFNEPNETSELEEPISLDCTSERQHFMKGYLQAFPRSGPRGFKSLDGHLFLKGFRERCLLLASKCKICFFTKYSNQYFMCYRLFCVILTLRPDGREKNHKLYTPMNVLQHNKS